MEFTHVFVSYVRENKGDVDRLCERLRSAGVRVWVDREQILPGQPWKLSIRDAIEAGSFFIACFSREYEQRDRTYMNEELTVAIEELRKRPTRRAWFIPVLINDCTVPSLSIGAGAQLADLHYADLHRDWDAGVQRILAVIGGDTAPKPETAVLSETVEQGDMNHQSKPAAGLSEPPRQRPIPIHEPAPFSRIGLRFEQPQGKRFVGAKLKSRAILQWMNQSDVLDGWCEHADDGSFDITSVVLGPRWTSVEAFVAALRQFLAAQNLDVILDQIWLDERYPGGHELAF